MQKENNLTAGQWCDYWFTANRKKWNGNTEGGYRNLIYSHIIPSVGGVALSDLTEQTITDFYNNLRSQGFGARSVWCVHLLLRRCLDEAAQDQLIPYNPVRLCQEPKAEEYKTAPLRLGQLQRYLNAAEQLGVLPIIYTGLSSGLRQCELITLSWADFHVRYRYILKGQRLLTLNEKAEHLLKRIPETASSYYHDKPQKRIPLSRQKEFRQIKNAVIQEAECLRLGEIGFEEKDMGQYDEPEEYCNASYDYWALRNMRSVQFSYAQTATQQFNKLFDGKRIFENPKNTADIKKLLAYITSDEADGIILDFFSGSATTAHAVMQLNAEDGGHRKFIMVQLPEPCDEKSEAYKAGYKNICEIGKERIRRAGEKIKSESPMTTQDLDVGFRVLKLDDTNMKDVYYAPDDYDQGMLAGLESNIKDDRTDLDLLFGCLIDWGLPLSLPYKSEQIDGCTVHTYNDGDLIACFDTNIPESVVKEIAQRKPLRAVFRDSGFASSPEKINVFEVFKLYMPEDANDISKRVRVI